MVVPMMRSVPTEWKEYLAERKKGGGSICDIVIVETNTEIENVIRV